MIERRSIQAVHYEINALAAGEGGGVAIFWSSAELYGGGGEGLRIFVLGDVDRVGVLILLTTSQENNLLTNHSTYRLLRHPFSSPPKTKPTHPIRQLAYSNHHPKSPHHNPPSLPNQKTPTAPRTPNPSKMHYFHHLEIFPNPSSKKALVNQSPPHLPQRKSPQLTPLYR